MGGVFDLDLGERKREGRRIQWWGFRKREEMGEGRTGEDGDGEGTNSVESKRLKVSDQQSFRSESDPESEVVVVSEPEKEGGRNERGREEKISSSSPRRRVDHHSRTRSTHWYQVGATQVEGQLK